MICSLILLLSDGQTSFWIVLRVKTETDKHTVWAERRIIYIKIQSVPRSKHTPSRLYKTSQLMLYREIIAVCSQIHTKHINTLYGLNVELLNVKLVVPIVTIRQRINHQDVKSYNGR